MSRLHRWIMPSILLTAFTVTAVPGYCQDAKTPDVIFVPTEQAVVDEMLRMANLSKNSVVYDLGCGDGRIVITAAIHYGTRGVGIDIDPARIRESKQNARAMDVRSASSSFKKICFTPISTRLRQLCCTSHRLSTSGFVRYCCAN